MRDIDERGMRTVMEEALRMAGRGTAGYHISLDMDWVDPEDAPGVGTPVRGGATYREAHLAMEIIADHGRMLSFENRGSESGWCREGESNPQDPKVGGF
jgi:arginase